MRQRNRFWEEKSKNTDFIDDLEKHPELKNLIRHDKNYNNKRKVAFESAVAGIIRKNPGFLHSIILKVAKSIRPDFVKAFDNPDANWLKQHFFDFFSNKLKAQLDVYIEYTALQNKPLAYQDWILKILDSQHEEDAYQQLTIIWAYGNYFMRACDYLNEYKDTPELKEYFNMKFGGVFFVPGLGNEDAQPKMKEIWEECNYGKNRDPNIRKARVSTEQLSRNTPTRKIGIFDEDNYVYDEELKDMIPTKETFHAAGKNLWRITSQSEFVEEARHKLDMPLIAGQGCSIGLLLIPAKVIAKLTHDEMRYFNLCAISYMTGNGHHAFHEFNAVWKTLDIPYTPGDYASLLPADLLKHPEFAKLQQKFPDLWRTNTTTDEKKHSRRL